MLKRKYLLDNNEKKDFAKSFFRHRAALVFNKILIGYSDKFEIQLKSEEVWDDPEFFAEFIYIDDTNNNIKLSFHNINDAIYMLQKNCKTFCLKSCYEIEDKINNVYVYCYPNNNVIVEILFNDETQYLNYSPNFHYIKEITDDKSYDDKNIAVKYTENELMKYLKYFTQKFES